MKRIEAVIAPWSLDAFKEAAPRLGIAEFDLIEVYRSRLERNAKPQRLYRGREFETELIPRLRIEFVLFDNHVQTTLPRLIELVHPESIAIFTLDQEIRTLSTTNSNFVRPLPPNGEISDMDAAPRPQIIGFVPTKGPRA